MFTQGRKTQNRVCEHFVNIELYKANLFIIISKCAVLLRKSAACAKAKMTLANALKAAQRATNAEPLCNHLPDRAHISALAHAHREAHKRVVVVQQRDVKNLHARLRKGDILPQPRERVGALAADSFRTKARRRVGMNPAQRLDHLAHKSGRARRNERDRADILDVKRIAIKPKPECRDILLVWQRQVGQELGVVARCDEQHAFGKRVERAAKPSLCAAQNAPESAQKRVRAHRGRLVGEEDSILCVCVCLGICARLRAHSPCAI